MRFLPSAALAALAFALTGSLAQHVHQEHGQLGKVAFANSCDAKVQPELQRAMAMLHSFWFTRGREGVSQRSRRRPALRHRHLRHRRAPDEQPARRAGRLGASGGKRAGGDRARPPHRARETQRERDYIEAVAAYYADFANKPERARQAARAQAFEALAARYPDDDEAQIFAALYIAGDPVAGGSDLRGVPEGGRRSSRRCSSSIPTIPASRTT